MSHTNSTPPAARLASRFQVAWRMADPKIRARASAVKRWPPKIARRSAVYVGEPLVELGYLAGDDVLITLPDLERALTGAPRADGPAVEARDRRDLGCRADQEEFVGYVQFVARGHGGHDLGAHAARDLDDAVARYAPQVDGVGYRVQHVAHEEEDVLARAFGHVTLPVQQERLVEAVLPRLLVGQHRVDVVAARLGLGGHDVTGAAAPGAGHELGALPQHIVPQVAAPRHGGHHEVRAVPFRVYP